MMFALMGEVNLWTFDDSIHIEDTNFGAFRYHDKRVDNTYEEGKRSYCQERGMTYVPENKKGNKLKHSIKYLEDQLRDNCVVYCQWYDDSIVQLMLNNGLLIQIQVCTFTGDVQEINFDKYLVGKLSEHVSDVIITKSHLVCTYNDNLVTLVYFTKTKMHIFDKINKLEPKLITIDLFIPNGRRLDKKVQVNKSADLILIWRKSTMNEVYPWSPAMKQYHRANIHLFRLTGYEAGSTNVYVDLLLFSLSSVTRDTWISSLLAESFGGLLASFVRFFLADSTFLHRLWCFFLCNSHTSFLY